MSHVPEFDHEAFVRERREAATHAFLGTVPEFSGGINLREFNDRIAAELVEYPSGVLRGIEDGKVNYLLVRDGPMMPRWAALLTKGAVGRKRNWMKANSKDDLERFRESASRHFEQWLNGETDEDHAAAVYFNINGAEHTKLVLGGASY